MSHNNGDSMNGLTLYSREVCPLCDEAEAMLLELDVAVTHSFIEDNLSLLERYGHRVQVLAHTTGAELVWPWDIDELRGWLGALRSP